MLYIFKESKRDWGLVIVVAMLAIGANIPSSLFESYSFDRRYLLAGLIAVVGVSLVRYLKFTLILVIFILALGSNLPEDIANGFGIDPQIMFLGLVSMVTISLSNRLFKLPTGLDKGGRPKSTHGAAALFMAILKGRIAMVQLLLKEGVNVNVRTVSGKTPLMAAAHKGYTDIVQLLLEQGANVVLKDSGGNSAFTFAQRGGYTRIVELLKKSGVS
jgi:ankyrin repeat protein